MLFCTLFYLVTQLLGVCYAVCYAILRDISVFIYVFFYYTLCHASQNPQITLTYSQIYDIILKQVFKLTKV